MGVQGRKRTGVKRAHLLHILIPWLEHYAGSWRCALCTIPSGRGFERFSDSTSLENSLPLVDFR